MLFNNPIQLNTIFDSGIKALQVFSGMSAGYHANHISRLASLYFSPVRIQAIARLKERACVKICTATPEGFLFVNSISRFRDLTFIEIAKRDLLQKGLVAAISNSAQCRVFLTSIACVGVKAYFSPLTLQETVHELLLQLALSWVRESPLGLLGAISAGVTAEIIRTTCNQISENTLDLAQR